MSSFLQEMIDEENRKCAIRLLKLNKLTTEEIAKCLSMPKEEVDQLMEELNKEKAVLLCTKSVCNNKDKI